MTTEVLFREGDDFIECLCGNAPHLDGFSVSDKTGKSLEGEYAPLPEWDGDTMRCNDCGRIFSLETLAVSGTRSLLYRCDICSTEVSPGTTPGILIEDDPNRALCVNCLDSLDEEGRELAHDDAAMGELHHCIEFAGPSSCCPGMVTCDLCGMALEQAGDALIVPSDELELDTTSDTVAVDAGELMHCDVCGSDTAASCRFDADPLCSCWRGIPCA